MELGNLEHLNPETVVTMLLLHSASPHGRRLAVKLSTEDPYDVDLRLDENCVNVNVEIAQAYLKTMGIRQIFKKTLVEMFRPAWFSPGAMIGKNNIPTEIYPAWFMTEKERQLVDNCMVPARFDGDGYNKMPAHFVPGWMNMRPPTERK